jgi:hypothetical protein
MPVRFFAESDLNLFSVRGMVVSHTQRYEGWLRKEFEEISGIVRVSDEARAKMEMELKMGAKELEVMLKVEMLESGKELENRLQTEGEVVRTLATEVGRRFQETDRAFNVRPPSCKHDARSDTHHVGPTEPGGRFEASTCSSSIRV